MANPTGKNSPFVKGNKFAVGNSGPPPKYTPEFIANEAKILQKWIEKDDDTKIYIGSFAKERGYCRQTLSEFAEKSEVFRDAYRNAKIWQEEKFIRNGLTKKWDPGFTARVMSRVCSHEWRNSWDKEDEKKDVPVQVNIYKYENG